MARGVSTPGLGRPTGVPQKINYRARADPHLTKDIRRTQAHDYHRDIEPTHITIILNTAKA